MQLVTIPCFTAEHGKYQTKYKQHNITFRLLEFRMSGQVTASSKVRSLCC